MASRLLPEKYADFGNIVERLLKTMGSRLDANPGSIARTLAEAFAREMATYYEMLELAHASGYVETAKGKALDHVVALLGTQRARAGRLIGHVEFSRSSPAPDDIAIAVGVLVTGNDTTRVIPIFATTKDAVLRRGETRVVVPVHEIDYDPKTARELPVINPGTLTVMPRPLFGIEAVKNPAPLRRNSEDESDDELRARARTTLRESDGGTFEAIAAAVRSEGVRQVTVRDRQDGPPGVVEVVVGDRDFASKLEWVKRVELAIGESKAAGIRVDLLYAKMVYFQPVFEVEPTEATLDDAGFDRLLRALENEITKFGEKQPVGKPLRRRRFEAALYNQPSVRNVGPITMRTFVWELDPFGTPRLAQETKSREGGADNDWILQSLETAVFDATTLRPEITRLRPAIYRFTIVVAVFKQETRSNDEVRKSLREGLEAYKGELDKKREYRETMTIEMQSLHDKLQDVARIASLRNVVITESSGRTIELTFDYPTYVVKAQSHFELGNVEILGDR